MSKELDATAPMTGPAAGAPGRSQVEIVGRAIAAADREDYMEDVERYDRRARAAIASLPNVLPAHAAAISVVNEQAEDEGLWFVAQTITEDLLQRALRRLHAAIEGDISAVDAPQAASEASVAPKTGGAA